MYVLTMLSKHQCTSHSPINMSIWKMQFTVHYQIAARQRKPVLSGPSTLHMPNGDLRPLIPDIQTAQQIDPKTFIVHYVMKLNKSGSFIPYGQVGFSQLIPEVQVFRVFFLLTVFLVFLQLTPRMKCSSQRHAMAQTTRFDAGMCLLGSYDYNMTSWGHIP